MMRGAVLQIALLLALVPAASNAQITQDLRASQLRLDSIRNERQRLQREMESLQSRVRDAARDLSNLGRCEEALTATAEAVTIRRRLATVNPAAYEPDLAMSLWTEAWVRVAHQYELPEALTAATESVERYEKLYGQIPAAYVRDLASALGILADVLDGLGRGDEATAVRARRDALTDEQ